MSDPQVDISEQRQVFLARYRSFSVKRTGVLTYPSPKWGARFEVERDLSQLFPYINSSVEGCQYFDNPERIQFVFEGVRCTLYSREIIAAALNDDGHARSYGEQLLGFLNSLHEKKAEVTPNYRKITPLFPLDIYKILPKTNCGECGWPSCLAFAGALSSGQANISGCPGVAQPIEEKATYAVVDEAGRLTKTIELDLPEQSSSYAPQPQLESILTKRELQVLKLVAQGLTNPEISERLFISPHTVKSHVVHIYEKLGVNDRAQAAVFASRYKLI